MTTHTDKLIDTLAQTWSSSGGNAAWILAGSYRDGLLHVADSAARKALSIGPGASHPDFLLLSPPIEDEKVQPIGIDQIRGFISALTLTSTGAGTRIAIIDQADRMTVQAANALLKTLEEPPAGMRVVLLTARPQDLPATIRSRTGLITVPMPDQESAIPLVAAAPADARILLDLADGDPTMANDLAKVGAADHWKALLQQLNSAKPFDRARLVRFSESIAQAWPLARHLLLTLIDRATLFKLGVIELADAEANACRLLAANGLKGLQLAHSLVLRVSTDTDTRHLDTRYAAYRLAVALGHATTPRRAP